MKGIDVFREYFKAYQDQYVLIGGAACDLIFEMQDTGFRATKDLDIVLIVEALTPEFGRQFWQFVRDGDYENRTRSNGTPQFYRFDHPKDARFPSMVELFSRKNDVFAEGPAGACIPIPLGDEISSLSAILLNEEYYHLLLQGRTALEEIAVLSPPYLIPFKAKAWLDLNEQKAKGKHIDEKDIKKHKNDVIRLATLLTGQEQCPLPETIRKDMKRFIDQLTINPVDPKALHLKGIHIGDILQVLHAVYD